MALARLRVTPGEERLPELRAGLRPQRHVLGHRYDARQRLRGVGAAAERQRQGDVPRPRVVVGVDGERLLERIERARRVAQPLLPQPAEANEEARALRSARALELQRQVVRDLLRRPRRLVRRRQRRRGPPGDSAHRHESLRHLARALVPRLDRQEVLDVGKRAFGLAQLVGIELDDAREEAALGRRVRLRVRGERLLVQPDDVAKTVRANEDGLEPHPRRLVPRVETQHLLQELRQAFVDTDAVDALERLGRAPQERRLFAPRLVRRRRRVEVCHLAVLERLSKELFELRKRCRVRRNQRQRTLEVRNRTRLVAEHVGEEAPRLIEKLCRSRGRYRLQPLSLRDALERERELTEALGPPRFGVHLLPRRRRQRAPRQGQKHRLERMFFRPALSPWPALARARLGEDWRSGRTRAGAAPGKRGRAKCSPRRVLLHGQTL